MLDTLALAAVSAGLSAGLICGFSRFSSNLFGQKTGDSVGYGSGGEKKSSFLCTVLSGAGRLRPAPNYIRLGQTVPASW